MENKLEKIGQNSFMDNFVKTDDILKDMCGIIESSQKAAYQAVNTTLIQRNWLLGYRIASEELQGEDRAKYGAEIIKKFNNQFLNEVEPFTKVNPTLENLTDYLFNRFGEELNKLNCSLDEISVSESPMRTYQISIR